MIYNYHTHTWRCSHASGGEEEYIQRAIECGIKHMGFSDHAAFVFPDGYESGYRVPMAEVECYVNELRELREKYKDKIDIKIGFEMEYYPMYFDEMLEIAKKAGGEYLILGQHFINNEHPQGNYTYAENYDVDDLKEYVSEVIAGMKSGVFTYVAHPDLFRFVGDNGVYREEMRKICKASKQYEIPLEINCLGIRDNRKYPNPLFWKIVGEEQSPVTFGFDAHDVKSAFDGESLITAKAMVEEFKLNYIGMPKIREI